MRVITNKAIEGFDPRAWAKKGESARYLYVIPENRVTEFARNVVDSAAVILNTSLPEGAI